MKTSKPSPLLVRLALVFCLILALSVPPPPASAASPPSDSDPMQGWIAASGLMPPARLNRVISFSSINDLKCEKISIAPRWVDLSDQEEESFDIYWTLPAFAAVLYLCGRLLAHKLRR